MKPATVQTFLAAHFVACGKAGIAFDDPCFDDGYFDDCAALLGMIERGASAADLAAYEAASAGVFDGWREWFNRTLAEMPSISATDERLGASEGRRATIQPKAPKSPVRP